MISVCVENLEEAVEVEEKEKEDGRFQSEKDRQKNSERNRQS